MKQSALTEESKKYKKISLPDKDISTTNSELRITSSINRISTKPNEISKLLLDTSKATPQELHEKLNIATEEIINLLYDMELAVLSEGAIPLIMGEKLHALRAIIFLCKIQLCLPQINEISLPEAFIEEYSKLLERTDKAIEAMKIRVNKLQTIEGTDSLKKVLEKNLLTLNMLRMHYIHALGLPDTN